ncbi:MAG: Hypoxanthine/guanine phosphoribosyltransferase [Methanosaeta sp. PtaB.Bin039]|nr:MAG: Hypoxanthine/guanine phosphoribosyltransferase [Methanosaeta sp. PtaB.Bin039]OPY45734.1 MAG: Hypoxanthine/guanine phosphoribosyltransferase [Methanosaeta sp. PtaU1.Bin028]HOT06580.1 hypoxanthine/guanine phosphoribosyltransferase [Methanotrichaceae archaeon]HQF16538.1 hypoxanthine/guanine phosphoribosyltransferase [Methanotrichaceae archaeon]HQI91091.1 hypoxanthine/guanine phosphoribosyltransferase [Methanotrichaceae archaeon]
MLEILKMSLREAPVFRRGEYNYFIHPITDGVPQVRPALIREVVGHIIRIADMDVDKIVTVEAMGIPIGMALSLATDIPLVIVRKRKYGLPGEIEVSQVTGYSKSQLFVNGIEKGDRVIMVDDVVSTGGTALAVCQALSVAGAIVKDLVVVIERGSGADLVRDAGYPLKTMVRVEVDPKRVYKVDEVSSRPGR